MLKPKPQDERWSVPTQGSSPPVVKWPGFISHACPSQGER